MGNLNAFGNKSLHNRSAGRTIGERREIKHKNNKLNNIPASRPRPRDDYQAKDPAAADRFQNKRDKYAGDVQRYVRRSTHDNAAYRHARVQRVHDGYVPPSKVRDDQRLAFLDKIINTPDLHNQKSIRRRFAGNASGARRS